MERINENEITIGTRVAALDNYGQPITGTVTEVRRGWVTVADDASPSSGYRNHVVRLEQCELMEEN